MLGLSWRRLWATPIFTLFAVVSLALGVGVTTAVYSVIGSVTRSGMDVRASDRIGVVVTNSSNGGWSFRSILSRPDFDDLARMTTAGPLAASAAFYQSISEESVTEAEPGEAVTGNYFAVLGVAPSRGRLIQSADDGGASRVVVLGHRFWRTRFAADPGVVGRVVRIGGQPFEIVGVAAEGFGGLTGRFASFTAMWVPLASAALFPSDAAPPKDPNDRRRGQLSVITALTGGTTAETMAAEVAAIGARLDAAVPVVRQTSEGAVAQVMPRRWSVRTLAAVKRDTTGGLVTAEVAVTAIVGLVLVVACTNLANLVLARGASRVHEIAVRRALGASRVRLVGEQLAESAILAVMGSIGAFLVTRVLLGWFGGASLAVGGGLVVQLDPVLDVATLTLAAVSLLASLIVFGLAPAVQLARVPLRPALSAEGGSTGRMRWRTRRTLIAVQVMIALSFFLMAAFAVRVVQDERAQPSGVDVDRLAMGRLDFWLPPWNEPLARDAVDRLLMLAPSQPGLESVAVMSGMPFGTTYTPGADVTTPDKPFLPDRKDYPFALLISATPSAFATIGVPIIQGRAFDARDTLGSQPVAVLSAFTARKLFGSTDVVGRECQLRFDTHVVEAFSASSASHIVTALVVGIAGDTDTTNRGLRRYGVVYVPLTQQFKSMLTLVGRTNGDPAALVPTLKALVKRTDPDLALVRPDTAALTITGPYVLLGVVSQFAAGLAALALALGMAGLFGVLSHLVSRRTREMGLRMALGAEPRQIRGLVLRDGFQPVASGLTMGYLIAMAVRLLMRSVYDSPFTASDAVVFLLAPVPIILAAFIACYWPAARASRVDPNVALRDL